MSSEPARRIRISAGHVIADATLNQSTTATKIWNSLPISANGNTWGDEIYFAIPVEAAEAADARETVDLGDLAFWPPGRAFCIFFGRTPASRGDEIRPASPVNVVGRMTSDSAAFRGFRSGSAIIVERLSV